LLLLSVQLALALVGEKGGTQRVLRGESLLLELF
jgi:hypothetical protein